MLCERCVGMWRMRSSPTAGRHFRSGLRTTCTTATVFVATLILASPMAEAFIKVSVVLPQGRGGESSRAMRDRYLNDMAIGVVRLSAEATMNASPVGTTTAVKVKRSMRNPVDTSQLVGSGSTFYASGYAEGNEDGWVLMQTVSGVGEDGRDVIAVVAPGKYSPGSFVQVEARHVVEKPQSLDWDRAAMLPFLVMRETMLKFANSVCTLLL